MRPAIRREDVAFGNGTLDPDNYRLLTNERKRSMESEVLRHEDSSSDQTKLHILGTVAISALLLVLIEFELIRSLIHLISLHSKSSYIWPAVAFQVFLFASLMQYLRFWKRLGEMHGGAQEKENIGANVSSLVFFLLLSLFVFSSVSVFFAKVN